MGCLHVLALVLATLSPSPDLIGQWSGRGLIAVNWTTQRELTAQLTIASDGAVTGTVGDAQIVNGRLSSNRGALGRAMNVKTDYIISGQLKGCIVASESVCRDSVKIPLNLRDGSLVGGIHTSGTMFGGKRSMTFTVARLSLQRPNSSARR